MLATKVWLRVWIAASTAMVSAPVAADEAAARALAAAEAAITTAGEHRAVWTTAADALRKARAASAAGDSAAAIQWSHETCALARLGLEQAGVTEPSLPGCPIRP